ncbi:hypothetical protein QBC45DRAFT_327572, partial [Copromyces sp. CBS 386.78]
ISWTASSKPLWRGGSSLGNVRPGTRCSGPRTLPGQPFSIPDSSLTTLSHMAPPGDGRGPDHGA